MKLLDKYTKILLLSGLCFALLTGIVHYVMTPVDTQMQLTEAEIGRIKEELKGKADKENVANSFRWITKSVEELKGDNRELKAGVEELQRDIKELLKRR